MFCSTVGVCESILIAVILGLLTLDRFGVAGWFGFVAVALFGY